MYQRQMTQNKTSLFSVHGKGSLYCFMVFVLVLRHLCPVHEVNVCFHSIRFKEKVTFPHFAIN